MKLPVTPKSFVKLLIAIAENGNPYVCNVRPNNPRFQRGHLNNAEDLELGNVVAEIQNWLGENESLLGKLGLKYNSHIF